MNTYLKKTMLAITATAIVTSGAISSPAIAASPLTVTVSKTTSLASAGEAVSVSVAGVPSGQGVYVYQCASTVASPRPDSTVCRSGMTDSLWLTTTGAGGSGDVSLTHQLSLLKEFTIGANSFDCSVDACGIFVRRDHVGGSTDFSLDTIVPIEFEKTVVQAPPVETLKAKVSNQIAFAAGSSELTNAVKRELKKEIANYKIASLVTITATAAITTGASTNAVKNLATKRANAIKKYLVKQGVPAGKIVIKTKIAKSGKKPSTKVVATP